MDAKELINKEIDFTDGRLENAPFVITKLECKILMESYHEAKSKEEAKERYKISMNAFCKSTIEPSEIFIHLAAFGK